MKFIQLITVTPRLTFSKLPAPRGRSRRRSVLPIHVHLVELDLIKDKIRAGRVIAWLAVTLGNPIYGLAEWPIEPSRRRIRAICIESTSRFVRDKGDGRTETSTGTTNFQRTIFREILWSIQEALMNRAWEINCNAWMVTDIRAIIKLAELARSNRVRYCDCCHITFIISISNYCFTWDTLSSNLIIKFYSQNTGKLMSFSIRTQLHGNWSATDGAEFPDSKCVTREWQGQFAACNETRPFVDFAESPSKNFPRGRFP